MMSEAKEVQTYSRFMVIWGDGHTRNLDRYECEDNIDALPDSALGWWEEADEPWCVQVVITSKQQELDLIQTCEWSEQVAGYELQGAL